MRCPFCQNDDTRVIDSRLTEDRDAVRRRRSCEACGERFSTLEQASLKLPYIVKSNGDREHYDESKHQLLTSGEREVNALRIGELVMNELREVDQVAYVRFASVYRSFQDVDAFSDEIKRLQQQTLHGRRAKREKAQADVNNGKSLKR